MSSDEENNAEMDEEMPGSNSNNVVGLSRNEDASAGAGLETIQNILFGEQMRAGQEQVDRVQQESREAIKELAARLDGRIDQLTDTVNAQFDEIKRSLEEHVSHAKRVEGRTDDAINTCRIALTESISSTREDVLLEMNQSLSELESRSVNRTKLAEMFTSIAQEVTSDDKQTKA